MIVTVAGHDVDLELEADEVVLDVMVLARVQSLDGRESCTVIGESAHTDAVVRAGLLHQAQVINDTDGWAKD